MQSSIDLGRPNLKAKRLLFAFALLHGLVGMLHRVVWRQKPWLGRGTAEHAVVAAMTVCTVASSFAVYSVLLNTGLKWWMVHRFLRQVRGLPCNIRRGGRGIPCNWRAIPCDIRRGGG